MRFSRLPPESSAAGQGQGGESEDDLPQRTLHKENLPNVVLNGFPLVPLAALRFFFALGMLLHLPITSSNSSTL